MNGWVCMKKTVVVQKMTRMGLAIKRQLRRMLPMAYIHSNTPKARGALYIAVKSISVSLTVALLLLAVFFGYLFYCNSTKMDAPTWGRFKMYVVLSDSMAPLLHTGDAVVVAKTDADRLAAGDTISFYAFESDVVVTHRITEITSTGDGYEFHTKGDNNDTQDAFITPGSRVIGKYAFKIPRFGVFMVNVSGKPYRIVLPMLAMAMLQLLLIMAEGKLKPSGERLPKSTAAKRA